jgi:NADPH:quinone reductase-like Zn-dependent oxidoreductase
VIHETFGGPDVLEVREVPEPHAGPGEVRIRVAAVGLNPMDGSIALFPEIAARFGITLPAGFGCDFAGIVDEVGGGVSGVSVGERVFGGAIAKAAAEYIVLAMPHDVLLHTPDGISDEVASTVPVAGLTAVAALDAIGLHAGTPSSSGALRAVSACSPSNSRD